MGDAFKALADPKGRTILDELTSRDGQSLFEDGRIGGGPSAVRDLLKAGLVDQLHVSIAPILPGRGVRLWGDLHGPEAGSQAASETAESGATHLAFRRRRG